MRKTFLIQKLHLLCLTALFSVVSMQGVVNWNGGVQNTDVVNDDLNISNDNQLDGGISIIANTTNVNVYVNAGDAIVRGTPTGPSRLFLLPSLGYTITFNLQDSLSFFGSSNGTPLLIFVDGGGQVEFKIDDNQSLLLSADGNGGGTRFYIMMRTTDSASLLFDRINTASAADVAVEVGERSILSYVAENPTTGNPGEEAAIAFLPTNSGSGRMILNIANSGAVLIGGSLIDAGLTPPAIFVNNIHMDVPAGDNAQMQTVSSDAAATSGLLVLNENLIYPNLVSDPFCTGTFNGNVAGFILRDHATLNIGSNSYVDYVGATTNTCLHPIIPTEIRNGVSVESLIKPRNASAFIVDSLSTNTEIPFIDNASIELEDNAGLFFRSGVNKFGVIEDYAGSSFAVDPLTKTIGAGNIVFDVEGELNIYGQTQNNRVELLSLDVLPTGGPIRYEQPAAPFIFPLRTFAVDMADEYISYNSACFLINGRAHLFSAILSHTDENHIVKEKNDCISEPTYVGGEALCFDVRPNISLYNSSFDLHTSAALVGVDILAPNLPSVGNLSALRFFYNGNAIDNCTGRQLILGTLVGSHACDGCTILDRDAHIDVMQELPELPDEDLGQELQILTLPNNDYIIENLGDVSGQFSLNTIYLGWASNISVGTNGDLLPYYDIPLTTTPILSIGDAASFGSANYISFETRGGLNRSPETSNVTGQGGIFVDNQGVITIATGNLANIGTMVTRSHNGVIDLPKNQAFFDLRLGIAQWNLDLNNPLQRVIVDEGQFISDYTLNWLSTIKDYAAFTPYVVEAFPPCQCDPVTPANITAVPTIKGRVQQLQIKGTRIGCPATIKVDCGWVEELVFLLGCNSGEAPTALVVLENEGRVGLGTAQRNLDSDSAQIKMGINGVTIVANGNGQIDLNSDILIDNICSIMPGPDLSSTATLTFFAQTPRVLRISETGILDLSSFTSPDQIIRFAGNVKVVVEPGAKIVLSRAGGVKMQFFDSSALIIEQFSGCTTLAGATSTSDSDDRRAVIMGIGTISLEDNSLMTVNRNAYLGIQTDVSPTPTVVTCNILTTSIVLELQDAAQVQVGQGFTERGGIFQVGNPTSQFIRDEAIIPATISFSLLLNGENTQFGIGSSGMLGFGVGIVDDSPALQNNWLVDTLFNVTNISLQLNDGLFAHNHIFAGDNANAALMAFGPASNYFFSFNELAGQIQGGSNMISLLPATLAIPGAVNPVVLTQNGQINERLSVAVLASTPLLRDLSGIYKPDLVNPATQASIFEYLQVADTGTTPNIRADAGDTGDNTYGILIEYVSQGQIIRRQIESFVGPDGQASSEGSEATSLGAVNASFRGNDPETNNDEPIVFVIPQIGTSQRGTKA